MRDHHRSYVHLGLRSGLGQRVSLVALGVLLAGCTSILGDFTPGSGTSVDDGGATDSGHPPVGRDGGSSEGGGVTEAGPPPLPDAGGNDAGDAGASDAGSPLYACTFGLKGGPISVDAFNGASAAGGAATPAGVLATGPRVLTVDANTARILVRRPQSAAFSAYTVDKVGRSATRFDSATPETVQAAQAIVGGTGVVTSRVKSTLVAGIGSTTISLYLYASTGVAFGNAGMSGAPVQIMSDSPLGTGVVQAAAFAPLVTPNDYVFAVSAGTGNSFVLGLGRTSQGTSGTLATLANGTTAYAAPLLLRDTLGDKVYVYLKSGASNVGPVAYAVPGSSPPKGVAPRPLSPKAPSVLLDVGGSAGTGYDYAFLELAGATPAAGGTVRIGQISEDRLDSFIASELTAGPVLSPEDVPADKGEAQFFGDDFVAIGKGSGKVSGLNFIWVGADGTEHASLTGANALLGNRPSAPAYSAIALSQRGKVGTARGLVIWNVVWTETTSIANGSSFDTLYLDELICQ